MKKNNIIFLLGIAALVSCNNAGKGLGSDIKTMSLSDNCTQVTDITDYIDNVKIIKLSSEEPLFFGNTKILLYKGGFVIQGGDFKVFNSEGVFDKTIGRVGRGPGEFTSLIDYCIDSDELLCLTPNNSLLRYSLADGSFLGKVDNLLKMNSNALLPLKNGGFAIFSAEPKPDEENVKHKIREYDSNGQLKEKTLATDEVSINMFRQFAFQSASNSYDLAYSAIPGVVYTSEDGEIKPLVRLDFGSKGLPANYFEGVDNIWSGNTIPDLFEDGHMKCPIVCHTDDLYYVSPFGEDSSLWNYISNGRKTICWQSIPDTTAPYYFSAADEDYFYFVYSEYELNETSDPLKKYLIEKHNLVLSESDGPVIVGVKFKL